MFLQFGWIFSMMLVVVTICWPIVINSAIATNVSTVISVVFLHAYVQCIYNSMVPTNIQISNLVQEKLSFNIWHLEFQCCVHNGSVVSILYIYICIGSLVQSKIQLSIWFIRVLHNRNLPVWFQCCDTKTCVPSWFITGSIHKTRSSQQITYI